VTAEYLDLAGVADRLGLAYQSVRSYRSQDSTFPAPDIVLGQSPGWLPETIDAWVARRPGHGFRGGRPRKVPPEGQI
jgi:predicted DNA-binding transcriptional regulator AlpA